MAKTCPGFTQNSNPLLEPEPWEVHLLAKEYIAATGGEEDKNKAAQNFNLWLSARNPDEMVVYTDRVTTIREGRKNSGTGTA